LGWVPVTLKFASLVWDAHDPEMLARFWAGALEWKIADGSDDEVVTLNPTDGTNFTFDFVAGAQTKTVPNQIHLDLSSSSLEDQHAAVRRFIDLGAREIDIGQSPDDNHFVLADPEGNEFCILEPGNSFVTKESRAGSLTCAGSHAVGIFWAAALEAQLVWDWNEETAIRVPGGAQQFMTWGGVPAASKPAKNRLHFDVAPPAGGDQAAETERLTSLGAKRIDIGQGDVPWVVMADPDGNEFCILTPR
jgi:catechol 2,3-dioxygenase-like lactoylglutathione lyase family enzyme